MDSYDHDSLYNTFYQVIRFHYHRTHMLLDEIGIYPGQPPMLLALSKENGQSQKELAKKLNIKPATITVMLKRMEKAKLVERRQDSLDQRISRVYITEQGKAAWKDVHEVMKTIDKECFSNFTQEEQILLRRLLMQVRDNLMDSCDIKLNVNNTKI
ncbi:MarR family winged helix-turn-helix transcriptional regulator [Clostridium algidicarnis]|uniref:MarR family winged helix-turn-helix transcriptional regulator n=1 Tax=Clostridium algidicarnis TaxID=37659 RepID=UPI001C0E1ED4|nr:MarR family transcriptional regulator [Clostridium algidicarnis]MBU3228294.1 MarR family transcriptional regulator [Clostridium algidicarnis]MBU3251351.1 MarR family transcriptional regulator [Clostridium algidicarnis]